MADKETEIWAAKTKQIEVERVKATKALDGQNARKIDLAYLDPKLINSKGFSRDPNVIMKSIERMTDKGMMFAFGGVALGIISYVASLVGFAFRLGAAGGMLSGVMSGLSSIGLGLATLMSIIVIGGEIFFKIKNKKKISSSLWTAVWTIIIVVLYVLIRSLIMN